jgi:hypothetical protein
VFRRWNDGVREAEQGTRVMFLTSLVGGLENGRVDFDIVGGEVGCEVRVGCGVGCEVAET